MASSDYKNASPDPLRDVAEDIVNQINTDNMEDIFRFCNVYVDLDFLVSIIQHVMQIVQRMFCLPNYFAFAFFRFTCYSGLSLFYLYQVSETKMIWMDRLGFDLRVWSPRGIYDVRIPFPMEVTDEKGAKSSFNGMSQLAWEVEKSYCPADFNKVKLLKQVVGSSHKGGQWQYYWLFFWLSPLFFVYKLMPELCIGSVVSRGIVSVLSNRACNVCHLFIYLLPGLFGALWCNRTWSNGSIFLNEKKS